MRSLATSDCRIDVAFNDGQLSQDFARKSSAILPSLRLNHRVDVKFHILEVHCVAPSPCYLDLGLSVKLIDDSFVVSLLVLV